MTNCSLRDKFWDTGVDFEKCTFFLFLFFFWINMYVSKALGFSISFYKKKFFPDFQQYLYMRVVNFSTLKLCELKLYIFWLFRVQTKKVTFIYSCTKFNLQNFFTYVKKN